MKLSFKVVKELKAIALDGGKPTKPAKITAAGEIPSTSESYIPTSSLSAHKLALSAIFSSLVVLFTGI